MSSAKDSASSGNTAPTPTADVSRFRSKRGMIVGAGILAMGIGTVVAFQQRPGAAPVPTWSWTSGAWWKNPVERNSANRMYVTEGPLSAVFALRGTEEVWFAGAGGLVIHSSDGGRTWRDTNLLAAFAPPTTRSAPAARASTRTRNGPRGLFSLASYTAQATQQAQDPRQQGAAVRVPSLLRLTRSEAALVLGKSGLELGRVANMFGAEALGVDSNGVVASQRPAPGTLVVRGSRVDVSIGGRVQRGIASTKRLDKPPPGPKPVGVKSPDASAATQTLPDITPASTDSTRFYPRFTAICFTPSRVGWVVGDNGAIFQSTDGNHWQQRFVSTAHFSAIGCDGEMGAVAVGDSDVVMLPVRGAPEVRSRSQRLADIAIGQGGVLWASVLSGQRRYIASSADTGRTWKTDNVASAKNASLGFYDRANGFSSGGASYGVRATQDGGRTWSEPRCKDWLKPDSTNHLRTIVAGSSFAAVGIDRTHRAWTTSDGWQTCERSAQFRGAATRLSAASASAWYAVDDDALMSEDGGRTWQSLVNRSRFSSLAFADSLHGWAGMENGEVARTSNAGRTWLYSRLDTLANKPVRHIAYRSPREVYATMDSGEVYTSTNRGASWHRMDTSDSLVTPVAFVSADLGWGLKGDTVNVTRDGGRSWARGKPAGVFRGLDSISRLRPRAFGVGVDTGGATGALWVVTTGRQLLRYTGMRWDTVSTEPLLAAVPVQGRLAYGLDAMGNLVRSTDDGRSWAPIPSDSRKYPAPWYYVFVTSCIGMTLAAARVTRPKPIRQISIADILVPDRPLREGDRDVLDFGRIAGGLSRFIQNSRTEPPLTIAITGPWGTGKSSLMNLLRRDLELRRYRTIWFNAWHHQREESLLGSLLEAIRLTATPPVWTGRGIRFRARLLWSRISRYALPMVALLPLFTLAVGYILREPQQRWGELGDAVRGVFHYLASLGDEATNLSEIQRHGGEATQKTVLALVISLIGTAVTFGKGLKAFGVKPDALAKSVVSAGQVRTSDAQPAFRYRFARDFREVTNALSPERLVIFVDDLDRCKPEQVLEILEAINFLTESGDCVVVLGIDRERVTGCVAIGFKEVATVLSDMINAARPAGPGSDLIGIANATPERRKSDTQHQIEYARHYLEKLLNMEVPIPPATAEGLGRVMTRAAPGAEPANNEEKVAADERNNKRYKRQLQLATMVLLMTMTFIAGFAGTAWLRGAAPSTPRAGVEVRGVAASDGPTRAPADSVRGATQPGAVADAARFLDQQVPIPLVPGATTATAWWLYLLLAVTGAATLIWLVTPTHANRIDDSAAFADALLAWAPVLFEDLQTPRSVKKFLNRVRFLSMSQRAPTPPRAPVERFVAWIKELPGVRSVVRAVDEPTDELPVFEAGAIPEVALVSLSVIAQRYPEWLHTDEFWKCDLRTFVKSQLEQIPPDIERALHGLEEIANRTDQLSVRRAYADYRPRWEGLAVWAGRH